MWYTIPKEVLEVFQPLFEGWTAGQLGRTGYPFNSRHLGILGPCSVQDPIRQQVHVGTDCHPLIAATSEQIFHRWAHSTPGDVQVVWAWQEFPRLGWPGCPRPAYRVPTGHVQLQVHGSQGSGTRQVSERQGHGSRLIGLQSICLISRLNLHHGRIPN